MHRNWVHLRLFGHWPAWFNLAPGMDACERCIKPPRRPNIPRLVPARSTLRA